MSARDEILSRVRAALTDVRTSPGARADHVASADVGAATSTPADATGETVELLAENVADYRATVIRAAAPDVAAVIVQALRDAGLRSVVVPTGLDPHWQRALGEAFEVMPESAATTQTLDQVDAVVTGSAVGIATTGTVVLDHGEDQGRRELTLVPDTHLCVIRADQVVHDVPEAVARLRTPSGHPRPLTWISGPSATSDIELQRVEGVHGPRNLIVVIVSSHVGS